MRENETYTWTFQGMEKLKKLDRTIFRSREGKKRILSNGSSDKHVERIIPILFHKLHRMQTATGTKTQIPITLNLILPQATIYKINHITVFDSIPRITDTDA